MRWYDTLLNFNELLSSYEIQSHRTQLVQIYGYRNKNRMNLLQAARNSTQLISDKVRRQIEELSVNTSNQ